MGAGEQSASSEFLSFSGETILKHFEHEPNRIFKTCVPLHPDLHCDRKLERNEERQEKDRMVEELSSSINRERMRAKGSERKQRWSVLVKIALMP